ncbi:DUF2268 domain-containing putative Zn-dependent protease [Pseudomonas sp. NPDC007930]|uniref:DUF2268 domain-containing putative Zn-dependent protease n=1 Tax=Pseudomonas sp. NPDC007930 TaxID=3364417 RepID=UPI0036E046F4
MPLHLHYLDARGALAEHRAWLQARLLSTYETASALLPLGPLDVIVKAGRQVIAEKGHLGYAPEPGVIYLTVDPANPQFSANPHASLERLFAHELHHAARWDGPGYGTTLGEALVSEGLAGAFALEALGGQPEPWECLPLQTLQAHVAQAERGWASTDYGHGRWFFGAGELPRWLGYSLGFALVNRYIAQHPGRCASALAHADAQVFRGVLDTL